MNSLRIYVSNLTTKKIYLNNIICQYNLDATFILKKLYIMKSLLFYCSILLFFFLNLLLRGVMHHNSIQSMLCIFCIMLFRSGTMYESAALFLLVILEDFIDTNFAGMTLFYTIPLAFTGMFLQKIMHPHSIVPIYIFLSIALLCKFALLAYFNNFKLFEAYTLYELFGNLMVLTLCLKLLFKGRLGNRL